jgi:hypothetical protein
MATDPNKKLSKLQRQILALALANRLAENRTDESRGTDLLYSQILHEVYGFPLREDLAYDGYNVCSLRERDGSRKYGHKHFEPEVIGRERFDAAQSSISRAMVRLEQRGLVVRMYGSISHWSG